jgi:hypothetical protein
VRRAQPMLGVVLSIVSCGHPLAPILAIPVEDALRSVDPRRPKRSSMAASIASSSTARATSWMAANCIQQKCARCQCAHTQSTHGTKSAAATY